MSYFKEKNWIHNISLGACSSNFILNGNFHRSGQDTFRAMKNSLYTYEHDCSANIPRLGLWKILTYIPCVINIICSFSNCINQNDIELIICIKWGSRVFLLKENFHAVTRGRFLDNSVNEEVCENRVASMT